MGLQAYSQHSFYPLSRQLKPTGPLVRFDLQIRANRVNERIYLFTGGQNSSLRVGIYGELGRGTNCEALCQDLLCFLNEQRRFDSKAESYWAVFFETEELSDAQFELKVRAELSYISDALKASKVNLKFEDVPKGKNISFTLGDDNFFVLGLHRNSADSSKRFHYATLVFSKDELLCPYQNH